MVTIEKVRSFKDLVVWQRALQLCLEIYVFTKDFPLDERFGLTSETRKTARSVLYNIAEGQQRHTTSEFIRFLDIARGSQGELETQLILATHLGYSLPAKSRKSMALCEEVGKLLCGLIRTLRQKRKTTPAGQ